MYYGAIKNVDIANGPGIRVSLFVSGCTNHCIGCFQPETWSFTYGQEFTSEVFEKLCEQLEKPYVAGLSILGGDPFEPENMDTVLDICKYVRSHYPDKSIWVWTGFMFEDFRESPIMRYIDVLVDGPFMLELRDLTLPYCGSSNQRVIDVQSSLNSGEVILWTEN